MLELLDLLKAIREFFTGPHSNERLFLCALQDHYHPPVSPAPCPFTDAQLYDKEGKWLLTKTQERRLADWSRSQHPESFDNKPKIEDVRKYLDLIPPMRHSCDEARRILTGKIELPHNFKRDALIEACEKLKSATFISTFQQRYAKLFEQSIGLLELHAQKGHVASTPKEPLSPTGRYSPSDLAEHYGLPVDTLKKRLERYRINNLTGWYEIENRGPRDPQFIFELSAVANIIDKLKKKMSCKTSRQRPT